MNANDYLAVCEMNSAIGPLTLAVYKDQLCHLDFGTCNDRESELKQWALRNGLPAVLIRDEMQCGEAMRQLSGYFAGTRKSFTLKLLMKGTDFQRKVWQALAEIPFGETRSYKEIAHRINNPKGARAIGMANNRNPVPIVIPCHRVIGASGALIGYGGGLATKRFLLNLEQV
ncbi:methylated-DNA--[protein]-cysteine S-methyltransferase [Sporolactobacillus sp. CPB3-1]|uniref:Methylated-DNA--protein-cysteine methyltransferase n=1 Tax=Sporolactobacillus mangiferae TaxID=2940498 RepID=A0ABT0M830_9BACL|nr:methylated-DNA--[protein]-cysteine S-methyltransferase [Sporolactobacillus mangiferae]MCL1630748.1 methylated-DNA--[protein]-cysteine S-methyltransferase [Sporolactobacillus mangiferae]